MLWMRSLYRLILRDQVCSMSFSSYIKVISPHDLQNINAFPYVAIIYMHFFMYWTWIIHFNRWIPNQRVSVLLCLSSLYILSLSICWGIRVWKVNLYVLFFNRNIQLPLQHIMLQYLLMKWQNCLCTFRVLYSKYILF